MTTPSSSFWWRTRESRPGRSRPPPRPRRSRRRSSRHWVWIPRRWTRSGKRARRCCPTWRPRCRAGSAPHELANGLRYDQAMPITLDHLRRYAIARSLFRPTTLGRAIGKLGFVQADPIRAPARAQDLTLRHRVAGYCAGDLERRYPRLPLEEDFFVNYGFLPRAHHGLMHPRTPRTEWSAARRRQAEAVLAFIRERGSVHPRAVDAHFAHGKITNWFGGSSNASTHLLDEMHYRGLLGVARRDGENGRA